MSKLKACPCGSKNVDIIYDCDGQKKQFVACLDCGFNVPTVKAWNTRSIDVAEIDRLKAEVANLMRYKIIIQEIKFLVANYEIQSEEYKFAMKQGGMMVDDIDKRVLMATVKSLQSNCDKLQSQLKAIRAAASPENIVIILKGITVGDKFHFKQLSENLSKEILKGGE